MNAETKHIVASNLTVAYAAGRKDTLDQPQIMEVYFRFVRMIEERETRTQDHTQTPGRPT